MILRIEQLQAAFEAIGFKPPAQEKKSVDDSDLDDDITEHEYQERRRLFTT